MKRIESYQPPAAPDLARLKDALGYTSARMADLAGLAMGAQWRKYTGGSDPRVLGMHMHFYIAAQLSLDNESIERVLETMRRHGAVVVDSSGDAPEPASRSRFDTTDWEWNVERLPDLIRDPSAREVFFTALKRIIESESKTELRCRSDAAISQVQLLKVAGLATATAVSDLREIVWMTGRAVSFI